MISKLVFKLVVEDDGIPVFVQPISYDSVSNIVSNYEDSKESDDFFKLVAKHPASEVRENVAYKDKISPEVLTILIKDKSLAVIRNLVRSQAFKEYASAEDIERLMYSDIEVAKNIASDIESYQNADVGKLSSLILAMGDPAVLADLAYNSRTPKKILRELTKHEDPRVAAQAKRSLDY